MDFTVIKCEGKQLELTDDLRVFPERVLQGQESDLLTDLGRRAQEEWGLAWPFVHHHFVTEPNQGRRRYQAPFLTLHS